MTDAPVPTTERVRSKYATVLDDTAGWRFSQEWAEDFDRWLSARLAQAKAEADAAWIERLSAMCDDDWLRRRDRCMKLPGASSRHDRSAASAYEHAAHDIRSLLNEHGYEDEYVNRHASYLAWMNGDRDRGEQERAKAEEAGR